MKYSNIHNYELEKLKIVNMIYNTNNKNIIYKNICLFIDKFYNNIGCNYTAYNMKNKILNIFAKPNCLDELEKMIMSNFKHA